MSKAKAAAYNASQQGSASSGSSFLQGFLTGQLVLALIIFFFIKFFIFGEPPSSDDRATTRAALRRQRTLSHAASLRRRSGSDLRRKRSSAGIRPGSGGSLSGGANVLTTEKILEKTYYNVDGHQPESLDWFNVLIAQTIAQLRADALDGDAILSTLTSALNGPQKPDFLDEIRVTEISLGDEFPIFSNCRVIPVDEQGVPVKDPGRGGKGGKGGIGESRLQARMDVDLSDVVTLGIETKLVLNYPKPFVAVLPVALAVSVVRFSGTLSLSFTPSEPPTTSANSGASGSDPSTPTHSPTTLTFTFLDDYRLDLSVHSLIGSRARLQDVPKIAQLVEQRLHAWFDERCVEPRFQQIVLPSLWPRKKNVRGGETDLESGEKPLSPFLQTPGLDGSVGSGGSETSLGAERSRERERSRGNEAGSKQNTARAKDGRWGSGREPATEEEMLAEAGAELRAAEERDRARERRERAAENGGMRHRMGQSREGSRDVRARA